MNEALFVIGFVSIFFILWLLPGKLEKKFFKFGKKLVKKQIKHEIKRFKL
jgi:hypothetical protein